MTLKKILSALLLATMLLTSISAFADVNIDYSQMTELPSGYTAVKNTGDSSESYSIELDTTEGALKICAGIKGVHAKGVNFTIPLGQTVSTTDNKLFSIITTFKFPDKSTTSGASRLKGFPSLSDGTNTLKFGLYDATWGDSNYIMAPFVDGKDEGLKTGTYALADAMIGGTNNWHFMTPAQKRNNGGYVTFRFDINPLDDTFVLYYSLDGTTFKKAYADRSFANGTPTNGVLPAGTIPSNISQFKFDAWNTKTAAADIGMGIYYIKSIKINNPIVLKTNDIEDLNPLVEGIQVNPTKDITFTFTDTIDAAEAIADNIYFEEIGAEANTPFVNDGIYTLTADNDKIKIDFAEGKGLDANKKYKLVVKNVEQMPMVEEYVLNTLPEYEIADAAATYADTTANASFKVKDLAVVNDGKSYIVLGALVDKTTNTTVDIDALSRTSTYSSTALVSTNETFTFTAPSAITAENKGNYEVRLYIWNQFDNSLSYAESIKVQF